MSSYTLFSQGTTGGHDDSDTGTQALGTVFTVSSSVSLTGIWQWSAPGCTKLPAECAVWNADTGLIVAGTDNPSPSWSGAAGSGWVKVSYDGSVTLTQGINYTVSAWNSTGTGGEWYGITAGSWSGGITHGPLSCPDQASRFTEPAATFLRPASAFGNFNIWVDVEVADIVPPVPQVPGFTAFMSSM
jgi:hypothetical protein